MGQYKATSQTTSNSVTRAGIGWDTTCESCSPCLAGTFRDSGDACRLTGSTKNGLSSCVACDVGQFKLSAGTWDAICDVCSSCDVGSERTDCGGASDGACTSWRVPTVVLVDGTGQNGGSTSGKNVLNIYGKYFGPVRSGPDALDVVVKYGPYTATKCEVLVADDGLGVIDALSNQGHIRCETVEGVGKGHALTVTIGVTKNLIIKKTSVAFNAEIRYQAPIVAT